VRRRRRQRLLLLGLDDSDSDSDSDGDDLYSLFDDSDLNELLSEDENDHAEYLLSRRLATEARTFRGTSPICYGSS
jgi:hypothetical protein